MLALKGDDCRAQNGLLPSQISADLKNRTLLHLLDSAFTLVSQSEERHVSSTKKNHS